MFFYQKKTNKNKKLGMRDAGWAVPQIEPANGMRDKTAKLSALGELNKL